VDLAGAIFGGRAGLLGGAAVAKLGKDPREVFVDVPLARFLLPVGRTAAGIAKQLDDCRVRVARDNKIAGLVRQHDAEVAFRQRQCDKKRQHQMAVFHTILICQTQLSIRVSLRISPNSVNLEVLRGRPLHEKDVF
jgi:hypothetical protein